MNLFQKNYELREKLKLADNEYTGIQRITDSTGHWTIMKVIT